MNKKAKTSHKAANTKMAPARPKPRSSRPVVHHRPASEIIVNQETSFQLARTVMTATLSTIAFCRDIFPGHRFAIRTYDCADPEATYESFMDGSNGTKFTFERSETNNWQILLRGTDRAVDKLLDWIEIAATDALQKKYLAKVQLSFHAVDDNDVSDSNLLEAYNILFNYENGMTQIDTVVGENDGSNSIVLRGAKEDLHGLINGVFCMIQHRPVLPAKGRMHMKLLYNSSCPSEYEPPGFHPCNDRNSILDSDKGAKLGSMNTGFHAISVNLFQQDLLDSQDRQSKFRESVGDGSLIATNNLILPLNLSSQQTRHRATRESTSTVRNLSMSSEVFGDGTQEFGLGLLNGMGASRNPETQDTLLISGRPPLPPTNYESLSISQDHVPTVLPYSQTILRVIEAHRQKANVHARQEDFDLDEPHSSGRQVACECGALIDEDDLIQCALCDDFKHIQCYGHLGSILKTAIFACYNCLLNFERNLFSEMKVICIQRRTLHYLRKKVVLHSIEDLADYLGRDENVTVEILTQLEAGGYVKGPATSRKARKWKGRSTEPLFTYIADDEKLLGHFFRPTLEIEHHLAVPESSQSRNTLSSETDNNTFMPDRILGSSQPSNSRSHLPDVQDHLDSAQEASMAGEDSSTEGTFSPQIVARRFSTRQRRTPSPFDGVLGNSNVGKKRSADLALRRSAINEQETSGTGLNENGRKRVKISAANSPWVVRGAAGI